MSTRVIPDRQLLPGGMPGRRATAKFPAAQVHLPHHRPGDAADHNR